MPSDATWTQKAAEEHHEQEYQTRQALRDTRASVCLTHCRTGHRGNLFDRSIMFTKQSSSVVFSPPHATRS